MEIYMIPRTAGGEPFSTVNIGGEQKVFCFPVHEVVMNKKATGGESRENRSAKGGAKKGGKVQRLRFGRQIKICIGSVEPCWRNLNARGRASD